MDIFTVAALGIVGAILSVTIKGLHPEIAITISLATAVVILIYISDNLRTVIAEFADIISKSGINTQYFQIALKACLVAYITQFASHICRDAGENAIATKVELAGKLSVVVMTVPVMSGFLDAINNLLNKI